MDICKCCIDKHGIQDLNGINNCCYTACADKMGVNNINDVIRSPCGEACKKCVDMSKLSQDSPHSFCYYRRIQPPVIWEGFDNRYKDYIKEHPLAFYLGFFLSGFFLAFLIAVIIVVIFGVNKKKK